MSNPSNSEAFFEAVEHRRTYYNLTKASTISNEKIQQLVERSVKHAPNAFNMQQSRAVVVTGGLHDQLWEKVLETFNNLSPGDEEKIKANSDKIRGGFKAGYGTVLFFEDQEIIQGWCGKMPNFSQAFQTWSENAAGILQYIVWTALETEGLGASLQHYAGFSDETQVEINRLLDTPVTWKCTAMMPFGTPSGPPGRPGQAKQFNSIEDRVKVHFE